MEAIKQLDSRTIYGIQRLHCKSLDRFFFVITTSGNGGAIWIATGLLLIFFYSQPLDGVAMILSVASCSLISNFLIKPIFSRQRPCDTDHSIPLLIHRPMGSSLPSVHAAASFAGVTVLCFAQPVLAIPALIYALLISFSRMYFFVHYLTDLMLGGILGILFSLFWTAVL
jgi:undecaprenyl-diphosphatase